MSLQELVRYVSRCCAQRPNCRNLYELAAKHDWDAGDVLAFLRSQRVPPKKMLRELAKELDISPEEMQRILHR